MKIVCTSGNRRLHSTLSSRGKRWATLGLSNWPLMPTWRVREKRFSPTWRSIQENLKYTLISLNSPMETAVERLTWQEIVCCICCRVKKYNLTKRCHTFLSLPKCVGSRGKREGNFRPKRWRKGLKCLREVHTIRKKCVTAKKVHSPSDCLFIFGIRNSDKSSLTEYNSFSLFVLFLLKTISHLRFSYCPLHEQRA